MLIGRRRVLLAATVASLAIVLAGTVMVLRGGGDAPPRPRMTAGTVPERLGGTAVTGAPELPADLATSLAPTTTAARTLGTTRTSIITTVEAGVWTNPDEGSTPTTRPPSTTEPTQPPCTAPVALLCAVNP